MPKTYTCSSCNQTFPYFADYKIHEAMHSPEDAYFCTWGGCNFVTLHKSSFHYHTDGHTGEQRYICPNDGCDYRTHMPSSLTYHRKKEHGFVPGPRGNRRDPAQSSSQPPPAGRAPSPWYILPIPIPTPTHATATATAGHAILSHPIPTPIHSIPASPTYPQPVAGSLIRPSGYRGRLHHAYRTRSGPQWVD
ncbi:hypothetical protein EV424DRAFT_969139 [Suillus variegatus]|nr:hypothetical protein EV424DRAFT_969139 [Suillus variegatus]